MLTTALIDRILATVPNRTIGLIGDLFLDRYFDIDPARDEPSVETGLTAYQVTRVRSYPGALGTVLNNLVALGVGTLVPIAILGDDGEGYELRQCLSKSAPRAAFSPAAHAARSDSSDISAGTHSRRRSGNSLAVMEPRI